MSVYTDIGYWGANRQPMAKAPEVEASDMAVSA